MYTSSAITQQSLSQPYHTVPEVHTIMLTVSIACMALGHVVLMLLIFSMCDICFMMGGLHVFQQQELEMQLSIYCRTRQCGFVRQYSCWLGYSSRVHTLECVVLLIISHTACIAGFKFSHKSSWTQSFILTHYHLAAFLRFHI